MNNNRYSGKAADRNFAGGYKKSYACGENNHPDKKTYKFKQGF